MERIVPCHCHFRFDLRLRPFRIVAFFRHHDRMEHVSRLFCGGDKLFVVIDGGYELFVNVCRNGESPVPVCTLFCQGVEPHHVVLVFGIEKHDIKNDRRRVVFCKRLQHPGMERAVPVPVFSELVLAPFVYVNYADAVIVIFRRVGILACCNILVRQAVPHIIGLVFQAVYQILEKREVLGKQAGNKGHADSHCRSDKKAFPDSPEPFHRPDPLPMVVWGIWN